MKLIDDSVRVSCLQFDFQVTVKTSATSGYSNVRSENNTETEAGYAREIFRGTPSSS